MKNVINYYYNLNPDKISKIFDRYYFFVNNELYFFVLFDKNIKDVMSMYEFNKDLIKYNILVNEIIDNRDNSVVTIYENKPYILVKVQVNQNKPITLSEISYLAKLKINYPNNLMRSNWANLWAEKIDYLEYLIDQNRYKYPLLMESFDYFVGLTENAIGYLNSTVLSVKPDDSDVGVISHDKILPTDTIYCIYDPLNIIIDHPSRDLAEYIKSSFFNDNYKIFDELDDYFKNNYISFYGINLLIARVLYPSFYFEALDQILNDKSDVNNINKITARISEYELYLADVFKYFKKYYNIREINWIKKNEVNLH